MILEADFFVLLPLLCQVNTSATEEKNGMHKALNKANKYKITPTSATFTFLMGATVTCETWAPDAIKTGTIVTCETWALDAVTTGAFEAVVTGVLEGVSAFEAAVAGALEVVAA